MGVARLYLLLPLFLFGAPTFLMGLSFPTLQRAVQDDPEQAARRVGLLQAANIAGCVGGSLLVGLFTLTAIGTTGTLRLLLGLGLLFAVVGLRREGARVSSRARRGPARAAHGAGPGSVSCGSAFTA